MVKNIMVIVGSPRINGNTEILADAFIEGARKKGHNIRKVHLGKIKVNGCIGCEQCFTKGKPCVQEDDMSEIYEGFEWADVIVWSSPLYFWSFSSQLKAVIDRLQALGVKYNYKFPHKETALIAVAADSSEHAFTQIISFYNYVIIRYFGWTNLGQVLIGNVHTKGSLASSPRLEEAKELGMSII